MYMSIVSNTYRIGKVRIEYVLLLTVSSQSLSIRGHREKVFLCLPLALIFIQENIFLNTRTYLYS